jgi:hypothetical protein
VYRAINSSLAVPCPPSGGHVTAGLIRPDIVVPFAGARSNISEIMRNFTTADAPETMDGNGVRDEIVRLEARMEELDETIESCRKFILASRIAVLGGACVVAAIMFGVIRFDPGAMAAAVAALLGGIVVWGSNNSTAQQAAGELAAAAGRRAALIELLDLHPVGERRLLH